jgi:hypothetical protein
MAVEQEIGSTPTPPQAVPRSDTTPTAPGRPAPRVDARAEAPAPVRIEPARVEPARIEPARVEPRPEPRPEPKIAPEPALEIEMPLAAAVVDASPAAPRAIQPASVAPPSAPIVRTVTQPKPIEPYTFGKLLSRTLALRPK